MDISFQGKRALVTGAGQGYILCQSTFMILLTRTQLVVRVLKTKINSGNGCIGLRLLNWG